MKKLLPWLAAAVVVAAGGYFLWRRGLPDNWDSLTESQKRAYLVARERNAAINPADFE